jgi:hypothetical protein
MATTTTTRRLLRAPLLAALVAGLLVPAIASTAAAASVNWWSAQGLGIGGPAGNPNCDDTDDVLGNNVWPELKIDPPTSGTYTSSDGYLTVTIVVTGGTFTWTSNKGVDAVLVKGGPDSALFVYDGKSAIANGDGAGALPGTPGPGESTGDTNTTTGNGGPPDVSHITFCYDIEDDTCTLTQGHWKTHSEFGPAPYDLTWALLPSGASTTFFLSGKTWYGALWTAPSGGSAYYILAHQYMAASLNVLFGVTPTAAVSAALAGAATFFTTATPATSLTSAQRAALIAMAGTLASFNEGAIGPGHCA